MSTRRWPDTLPLASVPGYDLSPVDQAIRTQMEVGARRARRVTLADLDMIGFEWRMTDPQMQAFRTWHKDQAVSLSGASDDLSGWSFANNVTRVAGGGFSPEGIAVDRVLETVTNAAHRVEWFRPAFAVDNGNLLFRATIRGVGRSLGRLWIATRSGAAAYTEFDLAAGSLGAQSGLVARTIEDRGNGWYRITITANLGTGALTPGIRIALRDAGNTDTYVGDTTRGFDVAEVQARFTTGYDLFVPSDAAGLALGAAGGTAWTFIPVATGGGLRLAEARFSGKYAANAGPGLIWTVKGEMEVRNA